MRGNALHCSAHGRSSAPVPALPSLPGPLATHSTSDLSHRTLPSWSAFPSTTLGLVTHEGVCVRVCVCVCACVAAAVYFCDCDGAIPAIAGAPVAAAAGQSHVCGTALETHVNALWRHDVAALDRADLERVEQRRGTRG
jgi:hypothetical protein